MRRFAGAAVAMWRLVILGKVGFEPTWVVPGRF